MLHICDYSIYMYICIYKYTYSIKICNTIKYIKIQSYSQNQLYIIRICDSLYLIIHTCGGVANKRPRPQMLRIFGPVLPRPPLSPLRIGGVRSMWMLKVKSFHVHMETKQKWIMAENTVNKWEFKLFEALFSMIFKHFSSEKVRH